MLAPDGSHRPPGGGEGLAAAAPRRCANPKPQTLNPSLSISDGDDLINFLRTNDVEEVDCCFTDALGRWRHCSFHPSMITAETLEHGFSFDGSSVPLLAAVNDSDMFMKPDPTACFPDPFRGFRVLHIMCNLLTKEGTPSRGCPRTIAQKCERHILGLGVADEVRLGFEAEFYVFDDVKYFSLKNKIGFEVTTKDPAQYCTHGGGSGYLVGGASDVYGSFRGELMKTLEGLGFWGCKHHAEVGFGQQELGLGFGGLLLSADRASLCKYAVKRAASNHSLTATFLPKPLPQAPGSGLHVHLSLWGGDRSRDRSRDPPHTGDGCGEPIPEQHAKGDPSGRYGTTLREAEGLGFSKNASNGQQTPNPQEKPQHGAAAPQTLNPKPQNPKPESGTKASPSNPSGEPSLSAPTPAADQTLNPKPSRLNLFYDPSGYGGLSRTALSAAAGILLHAPAILAFACPSTNSYKRLVPGFEAPTSLSFCEGDRGAAVRVPVVLGSMVSRGKRIEFRCGDFSGSAYLGFSAILMAALDGVRRLLPPPHTGETIPGRSQTPHTGETIPRRLPTSLAEALDALSQDRDFLLAGNVFDADFIDAYIALKRREVLQVEQTPHPKEYELYYHC